MLHHFPMNSAGEHANNLNLGNGSVNLASIVAPSMKRPQEIGKCRDGIKFLCSRCLGNGSATSTADASTNVDVPCFCI
ncbi:hypothetical protein KY284_020527 [Solanum tuberosum]|nr:hypothetical protein KY284_020527 [Solanum tuberosum]